MWIVRLALRQPYTIAVLAVLVFLLIIATSIPLAILTSVIILSLIGQTINIMTLGGSSAGRGHPGR